MSAHTYRGYASFSDICRAWVGFGSGFGIGFTLLLTRSSPSRHPPFTQYPSPWRSLVCDGQTSPHKPRLVVPHSTCPSLSPSPPAHSFIIGPPVINTHTPGALQTAHDIWENWTTGASHSDDSFSLGLLPTRGYWGPPIHNMGFCSRFGESPNTWRHFGPAPTQVLNSVISVLLRQETATWGGCDLSDGFWKGDYGWGVRVRRHFGERGRSSVRY